MKVKNQLINLDAIRLLNPDTDGQHYEICERFFEGWQDDLMDKLVRCLIGRVSNGYGVEYEDVWERYECTVRQRLHHAMTGILNIDPEDIA